MVRDASLLQACLETSPDVLHARREAGVIGQVLTSPPSVHVDPFHALGRSLFALLHGTLTCAIAGGCYP